MDYSSLTLKKLKELSKKEGLATKGNKQDYINSLEKLQKPAIDLIAPDLPKDVISPAPAAAAAPAPAPVEKPAPFVAAAPPPPIVESEPAVAMETAPAAVVVPVLRTSSRLIRPKICTMCVGCDHHPTHIAGKVPRKAAVVDDASIVDLADKFSTVNIVPQQQQDGSASVPDTAVTAAAPAPAVPSAKPSRTKKTTTTTTTTSTRAPLQSRSNQAVEGQVTAAKPARGKSVATSKKKVALLKDITAAAATDDGKENVSFCIEEAKVTTDRPGRRVRSVRQVKA